MTNKRKQNPKLIINIAAGIIRIANTMFVKDEVCQFIE